MLCAQSEGTSTDLFAEARREGGGFGGLRRVFRGLRLVGLRLVGLRLVPRHEPDLQLHLEFNILSMLHGVLLHYCSHITTATITLLVRHITEGSIFQ